MSFATAFTAFQFIEDCTKLLSSIKIADINSNAKILEKVYAPFTTRTNTRSDPFVVSNYILRRSYSETSDGYADTRRKRKYSDWYTGEYPARKSECMDSLCKYHEARGRLKRVEKKMKIVLETIQELHEVFCYEEDDNSYSPTQSSLLNE
jgi:hypothetical protein